MTQLLLRVQSVLAGTPKSLQGDEGAEKARPPGAIGHLDPVCLFGISKKVIKKTRPKFRMLQVLKIFC